VWWFNLQSTPKTLGSWTDGRISRWYSASTSFILFSDINAIWRCWRCCCCCWWWWWRYYGQFSVGRPPAVMSSCVRRVKVSWSIIQRPSTASAAVWLLLASWPAAGERRGGIRFRSGDERKKPPNQRQQPCTTRAQVQMWTDEKPSRHRRRIAEHFRKCSNMICTNSTDSHDACQNCNL